MLLVIEVINNSPNDAIKIFTDDSKIADRTRSDIYIDR